ncbi:hypothetical protein CPter291_4920 [Collimonas pratensis]|uniref:Uncharacterized protein n=1 Tax=Collimonas pratensis TaxID=279113 RepID=A0A127R490_9BURK|nr:hypothetical protein CPter91_5108 [Collimonas pratensis]AMP17133.1 hypothetical protein CPter291_4920 [Collimonas pratensis]
MASFLLYFALPKSNAVATNRPGAEKLQGTGANLTQYSPETI